MDASFASQDLRQRTCRRQRGLSLVEMMVGIAIGLFVVAGAVLVVTTQLGDNRRLLLETQLQQDLRATMDIITRELRRAGATGSPANVLWYQDSSAQPNEYAEVTIGSDQTEVIFNYRRNQQEGDWGFRLDGTTIESLVGDGGWQDLTDANTMRVTEFVVDLVDSSTETIPCPKACSADLNDTACWPTLTVRTYDVTIVAESLADAAVQRSIRSQVRLRNDEIRFNDPPASPTRACPP